MENIVRHLPCFWQSDITTDGRKIGAERIGPVKVQQSCVIVDSSQLDGFRLVGLVSRAEADATRINSCKVGLHWSRT